jgi:hypothetical protein
MEGDTGSFLADFTSFLKRDTCWKNYLETVILNPDCTLYSVFTGSDGSWA